MSEALVLEFDAATHTSAVLEAASYRMIGTASCQISLDGGQYICKLTAASAQKGKAPDSDQLRSRFLDFVTDEKLRASIATRTDPVRNLILSLAFGALAAEPEKPNS